MSKNGFLSQIIFNYLLAAIFIWFAIDFVSTSGWGFFTILCVLIATNDFVRGTKMLQIFIQISKNNKSN
ncbi:YdiK family protein [Carnobacterium gallinarum]|uniref:YdiK family protein n=1 Tax=Carnobacterium gallinarum TaxID=2749 RepID=UPI0005550A27|nr:YdiK family protein [Carnobacterium gallinarum]